MSHPHLSALKAAFAALACAGAVPLAAQTPPEPPARPALALMGTIPIFWGEADGLSDLLNGSGTPHWARAQLERQWRLVPLDHLDGAALNGVERLLLAQPRAFTPAENVALDAWVRGGGQLLLFADPMLTGESRFALGDRRRPQDVALLSPILAHWGLRLEFRDDEPAAVQMREFAGKSLPVRLAGQLVTDGVGAGCALESAGLIAACPLGQGQVLVVADAALLDLHEPAPCASPALEALAARAFAQARENAGAIAENNPKPAENCDFVRDPAVHGVPLEAFLTPHK
ncbi:MAG: ABC transporter [Croceibacterium sp.]